jgi:hypothetical protein
VWKSTPNLKRKLRGLNFPKEIREMIAEECRLRRSWHQTRTPQNRTNLNRITQQLTKKIRALRNSSINKFLINLTTDNNTEYSLWKAVKYLKCPITQVPPIRKADGQWARNNSDEAEMFAGHLKSRFLLNPGSDKLPELRLNDYEDTVPLATPKEVAEVHTNLNPKKASGFDMITGTILKKLQRKGLVKLTTIINASV